MVCLAGDPSAAGSPIADETATVYLHNKVNFVKQKLREENGLVVHAPHKDDGKQDHVPEKETASQRRLMTTIPNRETRKGAGPPRPPMLQAASLQGVRAVSNK
ncbi:hypothetical protein ABBQ32_012234 [Trebouxia sp. C0010 RCD-2024]